MDIGWCLDILVNCGLFLACAVVGLAGYCYTLWFGGGWFVVVCGLPGFAFVGLVCIVCCLVLT